jgi:predicted transcriptional regulator
MEKFTSIDQLRDALSFGMMRHKKTQLEVSSQTGISQSALSMFLSGKRGINGDYALRIQAYVLSLPPDASE